MGFATAVRANYQIGNNAVMKIRLFGLGRAFENAMFKIALRQ